MVQQICVRCGKTFEAKIRSAKYCSECKTTIKKETREKEKEEIKRKQLEDPNNHKICYICGKSFFSIRSNQNCCSEECQKEYSKQRSKEKYEQNKDHNVYTCQICGKEFTRSGSLKSHKYCSKECQKESARRKVCESRQIARESTFGDKEGYDYVVCPICGKKFRQISMAHLRDHHNLSIDEFKNLYPNIKLTCDKYIEDHLIGENNPGSRSKIDKETIRKRSPYCIEFWLSRGKSKEDYDMFMENEKRKAPFREKSNSVEYYLKRGYTEDDARSIIKTKTVSNGLKFYINRYGDELGPKLYNERIKKWAEKTIANGPRSSKANNFIEELLNSPGVNSKDFLYGDKEYRLIDFDEHKLYDLDMFNMVNHRVIEFNGDYWHCNPTIYKAEYYNKRKKKTAQEIWDYDRRKIEIIQKNGLEVMVVWEHDYTNNHDEVLKRAKEFLFENYEPSK